jgi:hypothetical protein
MAAPVQTILGLVREGPPNRVSPYRPRITRGQRQVPYRCAAAKLPFPQLKLFWTARLNPLNSCPGAQCAMAAGDVQRRVSFAAQDDGLVSECQPLLCDAEHADDATGYYPAQDGTGQAATICPNSDLPIYDTIHR